MNRKSSPIKKRPYQSVPVNKIDLERVGRDVAGKNIVIGVDVAKTKMVAAVMTDDKNVVAIVGWKHPQQTDDFLSLLDTISPTPSAMTPTSSAMAPTSSASSDISVGTATRSFSMELAMEPSGTYGDPLLHAFTKKKWPVFRVSGKRTHDASEVYDGVPSSHDGKSACVVAWLHLDGGSRVWKLPSTEQRELNAAVKMMTRSHKSALKQMNELEAELARHWPEVTQYVGLRRACLSALIAELPGPELVAADRADARRILRKSGKSFLTAAKIEQLLDSAEATHGVPMTSVEQQAMQELAREILAARKKHRAARALVKKLKECSPSARNWAPMTGEITAGVLAAKVGEASDFESAGAFVKTLGLNLKEHSSGEVRSSLRISKRGSRAARQYLYFLVLRLVASDPVVRAWYKKKVERDGGKRMKALIAVMRKIAKALWHVGRGAKFDAEKLFDTRRLGIAPASIEKHAA